jgi:cellulose synthase/poly-beta-1,6-N-acetylglucosamine synthase-like glycosyltransferase
MRIILDIIQYIIFSYLAFFALQNLLFAIAAKTKSKKIHPQSTELKRIAVFIPGYKEDNVIIETTESALRQNYPSDKFKIVVIADHFQPDTIVRLQQLPIIIIQTEFARSTKAKAINKAFKTLNDNDFDIVLILDADNEISSDFLFKINNSFTEGYIAVQGHRVAKALNGNMAILDAISEEINNTLFRKGLRALGLSSAIIGSGMAFDYQYFKKLMATINAVGGLDKEIELKMLREGKRIEYLEDAYIFDEKVSKLSDFYKQRRRWLSSQFYYFRTFFFDSCIQLFTKFNIDYFVKALQMAQPPRLFLLAFSVIMSAISFIPYLSTLNEQWLILTIIIILTLTLSTPWHFYNRKTLIALLLLPRTFLVMFYSFLTIKGANKSFIHTPHTANLTSKTTDKH